MEDGSGMEKMFFELASGSRLAILVLLQKEKLKMQEIARRLDFTATEAFRQLERLSNASLVERRSDGTFMISEYGKLVMQLSSSLEFISLHKDYFSTHSVMNFPVQFISRLGELSEATFSVDTIANLNKSQQAYLDAETFGFGMAEGTIPEFMAFKMNEKIKEGLNFKFLIPKERFPSSKQLADSPRNVQMRALLKLPAVMVVTEKFAGVCFLQLNGKVDYAGFFGNDPKFISWVKDAFLFYWENEGKS